MPRKRKSTDVFMESVQKKQNTNDAGPMRIAFLNLEDKEDKLLWELLYNNPHRFTIVETNQYASTQRKNVMLVIKYRDNGNRLEVNEDQLKSLPKINEDPKSKNRA